MRIRTIKPEFWTSESIGRLSREARLLFIGLWSFADDSGRGRGALPAISGSLLPYDSDALKLLPKWFAELEREGMVRRYIAEDGNTYYDIPKWLKHQKIEKPSASKFPPFTEGSPNIHRILPEGSPLEQGTGNREQGPMEQGTGTNGTGSKDHDSGASAPKAGKAKRRRGWDISGADENPPFGIPIPQTLDTPVFREAWAKWVKFKTGQKLWCDPKMMFSETIDGLAKLNPTLAAERIKRAIAGNYKSPLPFESPVAASKPTIPGLPEGYEGSVGQKRNRDMGYTDEMVAANTLRRQAIIEEQAREAEREQAAKMAAKAVSCPVGAPELPGMGEERGEAWRSP